MCHRYTRNMATVTSYLRRLEIKATSPPIRSPGGESRAIGPDSPWHCKNTRANLSAKTASLGAGTGMPRLPGTTATARAREHYENSGSEREQVSDMAAFLFDRGLRATPTGTGKLGQVIDHGEIWGLIKPPSHYGDKAGNTQEVFKETRRNPMTERSPRASATS